MNHINLKCGELVEVRSKEEILATLDARGQLDGLPFMPQMFKFCGQKMTVYKRAHKTCDTVNDYKGRRMRNAVHLQGARCDGAAYGGCEAACLIYWKEQWLRRTDSNSSQSASSSMTASPVACGLVHDESVVMAGTRKPGDETSEDPTYTCQATEVPSATEPLRWWEIGQYFEDYFSGNVSLWQMTCGFTYLGVYNLSRAGIGLGGPVRWLYAKFQRLVGGPPYPRQVGKVPPGQRTPTATLDLQPGELVRVKPYEAILETLDQSNKNRGLYFDAEVVPYCGKVFRVLRRVSKLVNEKNGKLIKVNGSVILENVFCRARYSNDRIFCPRALYQFMREVWLERVPSGSNSPLAMDPDLTCIRK